MKGIQGDAVLIFLGIIVLALVTTPLWYPVVARYILDKKRAIDKVREDVVKFQQQRDNPRDIAKAYFRDRPVKDISSMSPAERAAEYRRRAQQTGLYK